MPDRLFRFAVAPLTPSGALKQPRFDSGRRLPLSPRASAAARAIGDRAPLLLGGRSVTVEHMPIQSLENVGIVVDDLAAATAFFVELGLKLIGESPVEGDWVDRVVGLQGVHVDIAMLETADGHGRLELMRFHAPAARAGDVDAPPNTLGIRRVAFSVDDIDATVAGLRARGTELVGEVVRYENSYRLCYVRGPDGIIVMLAERLR